MAPDVPGTIAPQNVKFYTTTRLAYVLGAAGHLVLGLLFGWLGVPEMVWFNFLFSVPAFLTAFGLNRSGHHNRAFSLAFVELSCHQIAAVYFVGWDGGFQYWLIYLAGLTFFNGRWRNTLRAVLITVISACFGLLFLLFKTPQVYQLAPAHYSLLYLGNSLSALLALALLINHYVRAADTAENRLNATNLELSAKNREVERALSQRNQALGHLNRELSEAADYVRAILPREISDGPVRTTWRFVPSTSLGGDAFGYHWIDGDRFAVYLIDVSGHGVGAALLSVSVINALRSHTLPDADFKDPAAVLEALNTAFPSEENNDMFFTVWYGVYDPTTHELSYASGGHPPALLLPGSNGPSVASARLKTPNTVIGGLGAATYRKAAHRIPQGSTLYIFSDGVYEIRRSKGAMWTIEDFIGYMQQSQPMDGSRLDRLLTHVHHLCDARHFEDDFTILEVAFR